MPCCFDAVHELCLSTSWALVEKHSYLPYFQVFHRIVYKIFSSIKYLLQHISIIWKAVLALVGLAAAELFIILLTAYRLEMQLLIWFFGKLLLVPLILFIIIQMEKLQTGSQKIASGDLDYRVDTRRMFWEFKKHGENLNNISLGMSRCGRTHEKRKVQNRTDNQCVT